jgi:2',3'-cyclic-nucleotide 2'-phosphodiesterase (5'-nucleotidase family)
MISRIALIRISGFAVLVLLLGMTAGISLSQSDRSAAQRLTVLFTGDDLGNVKSCGCHRDGDLGGVSRRATYVSGLRAAGETVLLVELGDAISGSDRISEIKAATYDEAFRLLKYDAMGFGDAEVRFLGEHKRLPYGPAICANVVDASTGRLIAPAPYVIKTLPTGIRVGIIAVLGDRIIDGTAQTRLGIRILPPAEAVRQYVEKVRASADLVVLLSHTGCQVAEDLAAKVPGIDVILIAHTPVESREMVVHAGGAVLMQVLPGGKQVGKLVLNIGPDRHITASTGEQAPMSPDIPDDRDAAALIAKHDKQVQDYYLGPSGGSSSTPTGEPHVFVSASGCEGCHPAEYAHWMGTDHAKAFDNIKKLNHSSDVECEICHTTGFRSKGGFRSEAATPDLKAVQCESCHGPAVRHVLNPGKEYGTVIQSRCTECHDRAHCPKFDYRDYRNKIAHNMNMK